MVSSSRESVVPIIDVAPLIAQSGDQGAVAQAIGRACRDHGFFYVTHHGVSASLEQRLEDAAKAFFALPTDQKMAIAMARGGLAWRGYFPVGGELTSGLPDLKEGLYFGEHLTAQHPHVARGTPLHGPNLYLDLVPELRGAVEEFIAAMTQLGHALMRGIALSLGKEPNYFFDRYTREPLVLFRIFNYPDSASGLVPDAVWGVGEHTDYGLLTILKQDDAGGLQVKTRRGWIEAPPVPGSFVCNIGDMLELMTGGLYRSTLHRVRNTAGRDRLSFPFFFDPAFDAPMAPIAGLPKPPADEPVRRWDGADVHAFQGTYGDYLLGKVGKVFPELRKQVLAD